MMMGTVENGSLRTTAEALTEATGRDWVSWYELLDASGGASRSHRDIAAWLMSEHGLDNWWAQTVTVGYEQARGLRPVGGSRDGTFAANAGKTVGVNVSELYAAFLDERRRVAWLPDGSLALRTSTPDRSARFDWSSLAGSRVLVGFTANGERRSQVALSHERLPDAATAEKMRAYWRDRLTALKTQLEP
jgi:hypothetical protein